MTMTPRRLIPITPLSTRYILNPRLLSPVVLATFSTTAHLPRAPPLPPRPKPPPETEIEESFVKGSGPGGQKINKTSSAVQLKHVPTGIVVKSQATRSRGQNRTIARQLLAQRLDDLRNGDQSRAALVGQLKKKKRSSADKKSRRKYKKLVDAKPVGEDEEEGEEEEEEEDEEEGETRGEKETPGSSSSMSRTGHPP